MTLTQRSAGEDAPLVEVRNLTFTYPEAPAPLLREVNLSIYPGEMVILTGPSGCGKSTLCRHLNGIIPHLSRGEIISGQVLVKGLDVAETPVHELSTRVGMVHQNPESQLVCLDVRDELAFGPENVGLTHPEIVQRVEEVINWVGLHEVADALTFECSGGQKQRIALGSSLALLPELLVLDEPTTDLDPVGAREVVTTIGELRQKLGLAFLVVEHDLDELLEVADRMVVMDAGRILLEGPPATLLQEHYEQLQKVGLRLPQHIVISRALSGQAVGQGSFSVRRDESARQFARWAAGTGGVVTLPSQPEPQADPERTPPAIRLKDVSYSYDGRRKALAAIDLRVERGEFVAIVGANGSGKSTLARLLIGLLRPQEGSLSVLGMDPEATPIAELSRRVGYLFQNPDAQLFNTSVEAEVAFGMKVRGMPREQIGQRVEEVLAMLGLRKYRERHPFALSRGERQRLALATVLVTDPDLIILDEPTTGQDRRMLENLIQLMQEWIERKQATILMIAHDMNLVCEYAERTVVLSRGRKLCDGPTVEVFYEQFHALREMNLLPPPVVEVSHPVVGSALSRVMLSIAEFEWLLAQRPEDDTAVAGDVGQGGERFRRV